MSRRTERAVRAVLGVFEAVDQGWHVILGGVVDLRGVVVGSGVAERAGRARGLATDDVVGARARAVGRGFVRDWFDRCD